MNLRKELDDFWKWANKTPKEYSENRGFGEWECDYPNFDKIYIYTQDLLDKLNKNIDYEKINDLLEALAIDNEAEIVLEQFEEYLYNLKTLEEVIKTGYRFYQPQTRWQIAELMKRVDFDNRKYYLNEMLNDNDEYVRRRARLSLEEIEI